jgi:hypothetical protein
MMMNIRYDQVHHAGEALKMMMRLSHSIILGMLMVQVHNQAKAAAAVEDDAHLTAEHCPMLTRS